MREKLQAMVQLIHVNLTSSLFKTTVVASFFWGLIAHLYCFLHGSLTHDALDGLDAIGSDNDWKIALGRVLTPLYHLLTRGDVVLPWLIGVLALIYLTFTVFILVKLFKIRSKLLIFLVAGICIANNTVTATAATYIHDLDQNMFALLCSVVAVYCWQRFAKGFLLAILPLAVSIALYQAYLSVTITLVLITLVLGLFDGETVQATMKKGFKALGMCLGGIVVYFILLKATLLITAIDIHTGSYNSIDAVQSMSVGRFLSCLIRGYIKSGWLLVDAASAYHRIFNNLLHLSLLTIGAIGVCSKLFSTKRTLWAKFLTLLLLGLVPIGANVVYPLTNGMSHDLMHFAIWLIYLLIVLVVKHRSSFYALAIGLVLIILWGNVQLANATYLKKEYVSRAGDVYYAQLLGRIELMEEYIPGITPVVFVGCPDLMVDPSPTFQNVNRLIGARSDFILGIHWQKRYADYFEKILRHKILIADKDRWDALQQDYRVITMPCFPLKGSIKMVGDTLVVKQGRTEVEAFCPDITRLAQYCTNDFQLPQLEGWYAIPDADCLIAPLPSALASAFQSGDEVLAKPTYTNLPPPLPFYRAYLNDLRAISSPTQDMWEAKPLPGYIIQMPEKSYILLQHKREIPRSSIINLEVEKLSRKVLRNANVYNH